MACMIHTISTVRLYMPTNLSDPRIRQRVYEVALNAKQNFPSGFPSVTATDMGLGDKKTVGSEEESVQCLKMSERIKSLESRIEASSVNKLSTKQKRHYCEIFKKEQALQVKINSLKHKEKRYSFYSVSC
eukprot:TRINITY_DN4801_c0_g1_i1.p1 TRINITY_DN4801_c0_g1~~TRINITY_DN4801_c0_g1_i1.p1  ORF type:complete len:130 (-),score=2.23 TRINITY_DN4801_c0_g1_i1:14-403(-)